MLRQIRFEFLWLRARKRSVLGLVVLAASLLAILTLADVAGSIAIAGRSESGVIFAGAATSLLVPVAAGLGTLMSTGSNAEWSALLVAWEPERRKVLGGKLAAATLAGGALAAAISFGAAAVVLARYAGASTAEVLRVAGGATVGFSFWIVISSTLATILNSRAQALLLIISYWGVVQQIVTAINKDIANVLPAGAVRSLIGSPGGLPVTFGLLACAFWCFLFGLAAEQRFFRQDL